MKADEIDVADAGAALDEALDRLGMEPGQLALDLGDWPDAAEHAAQPLAEALGIGHGQRRARSSTRSLAVGLDQRDIDAVERGAAHQPDRARQGGGSRRCWSVPPRPHARRCAMAHWFPAFLQGRAAAAIVAAVILC